MQKKYRIMIVDDEEEVRLGIVKKLDWDQLGYEVAADAENGEEALLKAEEQELDVVMTDIKMPYMDGLQFCSELLKINPGVKLIILSGFGDFEYAKEAIRLNVVEYVLKPVNAAELSQILTRVRATLDAEMAERRNVIRLAESYERSLPLLRENFLEKLITGAAQLGEIGAAAVSYNIRLDNNPYKAAAIFVAGKDTQMEPRLVPFLLRDLISDRFKSGFTVETLIRFPAVVALISFESKDINGVIGAAGDVCARAKKALCADCRAGVSRICRDMSEFDEAYYEAAAALDYRSLSRSPVIYIRDMESSDRFRAGMQPQGMGELERAVRFGDCEMVETAVKAAVSRLPSKEDDAYGYAECALRLVAEVVGIMRQLPPDGAQGGELALMPNPFELDREKLLERVLCECLSANSRIQITRQSGTAQMIAAARTYIESNFADTGLSVDKLCEELHISRSYFSTLFKQETGSSFVQYLTDVRLGRAMVLLDSTDDKTFVIAGEVGYDDPNYFSYVFKKKYGVSPTLYRKSRTV